MKGFWIKLVLFFSFFLLVGSPSVEAGSRAPSSHGSDEAAANDSGQDQAPKNVCIECHEQLGGQYGAPVALWQTSFHAKMGNSCEGCHGGNPLDADLAMEPSEGFVGVPKPTEIATFCGKCHVGIEENYIKSPHYNASQAGKKAPTCVTCHHSHDVVQASMAMINESLCAQCHSYDQAREIKKAFVTAEVKLEEERELLDYLDHRGMKIRRQREKLFALRNSLHQMTHTLDVPLIKSKTGAVMETLEGLHANSLELKKKVIHRWWVGGLIALFFLVTAFVLRAFKKTFDEDEGESL